MPYAPGKIHSVPLATSTVPENLPAAASCSAISPRSGNKSEITKRDDTEEINQKNQSLGRCETKVDAVMLEKGCSAARRQVRQGHRHIERWAARARDAVATPRIGVGQRADRLTIRGFQHRVGFGRAHRQVRVHLNAAVPVVTAVDRLEITPERDLDGQGAAVQGEGRRPGVAVLVVAHADSCYRK